MELVYFGDPVLASATEPVTDIESQVRPVLDDMWKVMVYHDGVGLAAPQVGIALAFFIFDNRGEMGVAINPTISARGAAIFGREGCLSGHSRMFNLKRPSWVLASWTDLDDAAHEEKFVRDEARLWQHEVDHLNGCVITDRMRQRRR